MNRDQTPSETLQRAYAGQPTLIDAEHLPRQSGARLVTLNFIRLALEMHRQIEGDELILWLLTADAAKTTKSICEHWSVAADALSSWDIIKTPFFRKFTHLSDSSREFTYTPNGNCKKLRSLLDRHMGNTSLAAAIIDNGRDSLGCLKFQYHSFRGQMFLTFNSQVTKPGVAGIYLCKSSSQTAEFIARNLEPPESGPNERVSFYVLLERTTSNGDVSGVAMSEQSQEVQTSTSLQHPTNTISSRITASSGEVPNSSPTVQTQSESIEVPNPSTQIFEDLTFITNTDFEVAVSPDLDEDFMKSRYSSLALRIADEEEELVDILQLSLVEAESSTNQSFDVQLSQVHEDVGAPTTQPLNSVHFECGVCLDRYREESVTRLSDCQHIFCEDCLKGTVQADLRSRKFPVLCPACRADGRVEEPTVINEFTIRKLGITGKEMEIFEELQNSSVSIKVTCNSCKNSVLVDRADYNGLNEILCPVGCGHRWCKECQQKIDHEGPRHFCDSTTGLHSLSESLGWKQCPGCRTLIEKIKGCNHMACSAPACNTHFCYNCGGEIIKSRNPDEIKYAVMFHDCELVATREPALDPWDATNETEPLFDTPTPQVASWSSSLPWQ
ncbi:putative E3 ubiquitin-protein ligase ARI5 [Termitomyces sp. J132]|nr:putative E3 ubiquitin-protein ligase ARI5 [Termitomyces sp. J132]